MKRAREEAIGLYKAGAMRRGELVSRGAALTEREANRAGTSRGDSICWLEGSGAKERCPALARLDDMLAAFVMKACGKVLRGPRYSRVPTLRNPDV